MSMSSLHASKVETLLSLAASVWSQHKKVVGLYVPHEVDSVRTLSIQSVTDEVTQEGVQAIEMHLSSIQHCLDCQHPSFTSTPHPGTPRVIARRSLAGTRGCAVEISNRARFHHTHHVSL